MLICKMCARQVEKFARSHIYPNAMTRALRDDGSPLVAMSTFQGPRVSRADAGLFDASMVCPDCEMLFGPADQYAIEFWKRVCRKAPPFQIVSGSELLEYQARPEVLHLFAMQTLLRCSLSSRPEFRAVDLPQLRDSLWGPLNGRGYSITKGPEVAFIFTVGPIGGVVTTPRYVQQGEHSMYLLGLPYLQILIAESPSLPEGFSGLVLRPGVSALVWRRRKMLHQEVSLFHPMVDATKGPAERIFSAARRKADAGNYRG